MKSKREDLFQRRSWCLFFFTVAAVETICIVCGIVQITQSDSFSSPNLAAEAHRYSTSLLRDSDVLMNRPNNHDTSMALFSPIKKSWLVPEGGRTHRVNYTILGEKEEVIVRLPVEKWPTTEHIQEVITKKKGEATTSVQPPPVEIDQIYYINMKKNYKRRAIMDSWLSQQPIPYKRVPGKQGKPDVCAEGKRADRCIGISGLTFSNLNIMDNYKTSNITLVLEDDFVVHDMEKLLLSIQLVPQDWDILRFDCSEWNNPDDVGFPWISKFSFQVQPVNESHCESIGLTRCRFCGGTHAVLWRDGESLEKLKKLFTTKPFEGVDCRFESQLAVDLSLKSYCINVGVGSLQGPVNEYSDISEKPKTV